MSDSRPSLLDMDLHLASVIYTNEPPSPTQKRQIKGLIASLRDDVLELDEEISRAQAKREARLRRINTYAAALSPCRRLPPELVSKVLLHAHEGYPIRPSNCLRLAQICNAWREVAIRMPGLWTDIDIDFRKKTYTKKMLLLNAFCDRAAGCPLSVRIGGHNSPPDVNNFIGILKPYLKNIKSLKLDISSHYFHIICSLPPDSFTLLEDFLFKSKHPVQSRIDAEFTTKGPFALAHRLKTFSASGPFQGITVHLPEQLTHANLDGFTCAQAISALRNCPHIVELRGVFDDAGDSFPDKPIVTPSLQTLDITVDGEVDVHDIFDHITTPALNSLQIVYHDSDFTMREIWLPTSFASLVSRSSCVPTRLSLSYVDMSSTEFLDVLRLLPSLVIINLRIIAFMEDNVWAALVYKDDHTLLPKLEELMVLSFECSPTDDVILEVATSRWWPLTETQGVGAPNPNGRPSRLKKFKIITEGRSDGRTSVQQNVGEEVARLVEEGLAIHIMFQD